jgi:hypothetical protein
MAEGIPTRLTAAAGRRFGLTVGGAVPSARCDRLVARSPDHHDGARRAGCRARRRRAIIPTYLGPVERAWMTLAHLISKVTTPIVMGVMYMWC